MIDWLTAWLSPIQAVLRRRGYDRSYIGGSSAREILDHIFFAAGISLRDLDLYVVRHGQAMPKDIGVLCADLQSHGESGPLREKRRANPALPAPACYDYLAGYGVHLRTANRPILSLSVLHHPADLKLNGLFDMDAIFLVVPNDKPFAWYAHEVRRNITQLVLDPYGGYRAWRTHRPEIVHWAEVERCYARNAFRIVRSLAKAGTLKVPENLVIEYRRRRPAEIVVDDPAELKRDFRKVLADRYWAEELAMVTELTDFDYGELA
ncbi:hypothetical protein [Actinocrispum sp. NPDC049592]|uniref:hypothetical protein n=1 Tax=Actinocrispum sp. NPDC049592 TaxID=3154835 RepID=UPI003412FE9A